MELDPDEELLREVKNAKSGNEISNKRKVLAQDKKRLRSMLEDNNVSQAQSHFMKKGGKNKGFNGFSMDRKKRPLVVVAR